MLLMPPTLDEPLFPILYNTALLRSVQDKPQITMRRFVTEYIRAIKHESVKVEVVNPKENLFILRGCVWLQIISSDQDMQQVRKDMRERMHIEGAVQNTLILMRRTPPLWGMVLISTKWLKPRQPKEGIYVR